MSRISPAIKAIPRDLRSSLDQNYLIGIQDIGIQDHFTEHTSFRKFFDLLVELESEGHQELLHHVLHTNLGEWQPVWETLSQVAGGYKSLLEHALLIHLKSLVGDDITPTDVFAHEQILNHHQMAGWLTHWLIHSLIETQLASGVLITEYRPLLRSMLQNMIRDFSAQPSATSLLDVLSNAEKKTAFMQLLVRSHFRRDLKVINDPLLPLIFNKKNIKNDRIFLALVTSIQVWQAFSPRNESLSTTLHHHFNLSTTPSRKDVMYAMLALPYKMRYESVYQKNTPSESAAAFHWWAFKCFEWVETSNGAVSGPQSDHLKHTTFHQVTFFIHLLERGGLLDFRRTEGQKYLNQQQLHTWDRELTIENPGHNTHWRTVNTIDPPRMLQMSRYTVQSCMNVYRDQKSHHYHLGRFLNPLNRQLEVWHGQAFAGRAMIRIMFTRDQKPALFLDKVYYSDETHPRNQQAGEELLNQAQILSRDLGIPLVLQMNTAMTFNPTVWFTEDREQLLHPSLSYPDYYDAEIHNETRIYRGRMEIESVPVIVGIPWVSDKQ